MAPNFSGSGDLKRIEAQGSQRAHDRDREVTRRQFSLAMDLAAVQIEAAEKQILVAVWWLRVTAISVTVVAVVVLIALASLVWFEL